MHQARRRITTAFGVAAATALIAACGGGDSNGDGDAAPPDETTTTIGQPDDTTTSSEVALDDTPTGPLEFASSIPMEPITRGDERAFPLGEPGDLVLELGPPEPATDEEVDDLFRGGDGEAERRTARLSLGDAVVELGEVVLPTGFPVDLLEQNAGGTSISFTDVQLDDIEFIPAGTPASEYCSLTDTGEVAGGWLYDGSPGELSVTFTIDVSEAGNLAGVGVLAGWTSPVERELFDDVDIADRVDRCINETALTQWGGGTLLGS